MSETQSAAERALAELLVDVLGLEDVQAADIAPDAPLFGHDDDSLGLDSIDALEIAQAIAQNYNVQLRADDDRNKATFRSLRSLSNFIIEHRAS